jgi:formamidase
LETDSIFRFDGTPLANLPNPKNAVLGSLEGAMYDRVAKEARRSRERHGSLSVSHRESDA